MTSLDAQKISLVDRVIDHIIDALGDSSVSLRRALILVDIDENPQSTQAEIAERLEEDKSTLSRNTDWLLDHGCIDRVTDITDARLIRLRSADFSSRHIGYALAFFEGSHADLKNFLIQFICVFKEKMPSLREAKILASLGAMDGASQAELSKTLNDIPSSTQRRIVAALNEDGLIEKNG